MVAAKVQFMVHQSASFRYSRREIDSHQGINIAGFEFGCEIDGTCPTSSVSPPLSTLGGGDGAGQMQHFVKDDQMNVFRLREQTKLVYEPLIADKYQPFRGNTQSTTNLAAHWTAQTLANTTN